MKKNLALLFSSIFISLLIAEFAIRAIGYEKTTVTPLGGFHQYDKDLGWALIPNFESKFAHRDFTVAIKTNSRGFRDEEYDYKKPISKKRIVGLGDSFTWGWGVEKNEIYLEVAESLMDWVEILNMGQNAYGTGQEYLYFKKFGEKYSPDLVTVAFVQNDLKDNIDGKGPIFGIVNDEIKLLSPPKNNSADRIIKKFLVKHSHLYASILHGYHVLNDMIKSFISTNINDKVEKSGIPGKMAIYRKVIDETMEERWTIVEKILLELHRESDEKLLVIYAPPRVQIERDRDIFRKFHADTEKYDFNYPNERLRKFTEKAGIYYLDLVEPFRREYISSPGLYFEHDTHWSKFGHRVAGEMLAEKLGEIFASDIK